MSENIVFRPFKVDDFDYIGSMKKKYFEPEINLPSCQKILEVTKTFSDNLLVAEYSGKVIGCIFANPSLGPLISLIVVEEEFRRKGIATKLIKKLEDVLLNRGFREVWANAYNDQAKSLFRKNGYEDTDYGLMKRQLPQHI